MKLAYVISGLSTGGAEVMLYKLLSAWDRRADQLEVISLTDLGALGPRIAQLGIPVRALGMRKGTGTFTGLVRLAKWLRSSSPQVVQTWMYHADLIGGLAASLGGCRTVVWGIRNGVLEACRNKRSTIWTAKVCAHLSGRIPRKIVCCSEEARRFHESIQYCAEKMTVIPNGFDLASFKPDASARDSFRNELGAPGGAILIGLVARFDPHKDHQTFIEAARRIAESRPETLFVLCGENITRENSALAGWIGDTQLKGRFRLLGRRDDIPGIMAALDVLVSSSCGEAFPNVVGEAMACGVPCVVTDVGDSAMIVGDTGLVVPAKNPAALAEACLKLIDAGKERREQLGNAARRRVKDEFDLNVIASRYRRLYEDLAGRTPAGAN